MESLVIRTRRMSSRGGDAVNTNNRGALRTHAPAGLPATPPRPPAAMAASRSVPDDGVPSLASRAFISS